jgi:hypothetical protein
MGPLGCGISQRCNVAKQKQHKQNDEITDKYFLKIL